MKRIFVIALLLYFAPGCTAQSDKEKNGRSSTADTAQPAPKVSWKVNRQFDSEGNLIRYDSTYSWSYSGSGKTHQVTADSVMHSFKKHFDSLFPSIFENTFGDPVWNDSMFYRDFIMPDYFLHKWERQHYDMESMMHQMDSLRNSFLNEQYPGLTTKPGS